MNVLGLNTMENASASLVMDNRIVAAAEEERFTRVKHQDGTPVRAIQYCLREGGIGLKDIDLVALNWQPWRLGRRILHVLKYGLTSPRLFLEKARRGAQETVGDEWRRMMTLPWRLPQLLGEERAERGYRFKFMDHHHCHAASAFYPSPFEKAAILTLDGAGESACIVSGQGDGSVIRRIGEIGLPHSLGHLYSAVTAFLGFRACSGEGKVMGLAPYGEDHYGECFERILRLREKGKVAVDFRYLDYHLARRGVFSPLTRRLFGEPREKEGGVEKRHEDIAASLQKALERAALHVAAQLARETRLDTLCLAGGVALNACMNYRLEQSSPFRRVFIQPAAGDAGSSLGAALAAAPPPEHERRPMTHTFLGPGFTEAEIDGAITAIGLKAVHCPDIQETVAGLLARGKIVGWFQGRMEFGPRALGNRSILADPRKAEMKDILNARVKHREYFRPFAPAVLEECMGDFFTGADSSPFMTKIADVIPRMRDLIPATVHVDGTARLQTVSRESNREFYGLIEKFRRLTGTPVILNTSFNVRGEPIVCTPEDATACYLGTEMDALAIGNRLLAKKSEDLNPAHGD